MAGVRAVLAPHVTTLVGAGALAAMEYLDSAGGDPHIELGADERVRNRIQEVMDLNVIVEVDARAPPFRELPIVGRQPVEGVALDLLEQLPAANAEFRMGRSFMRCMTSAMAALHSASEKKVCRRNRPRI